MLRLTVSVCLAVFMHQHLAEQIRGPDLNLKAGTGWLGSETAA
jgi:hypothetical protein